MGKAGEILYKPSECFHSYLIASITIASLTLYFMLWKISLLDIICKTLVYLIFFVLIGEENFM